MNSTIDAMKMAIVALTTGNPSKAEPAAYALRAAIAHERSQGGGPATPLFTKPAPSIKEVVVNADYRAMWAEQVQINQRLCAQLAAPATEPDKPSAGERDALIAELRAELRDSDYMTEWAGPVGDTRLPTLAWRAADMLAADAQALTTNSVVYQKDGIVNDKTQQVAVPQELSHDLLERLSWTLTDLGYVQPEGGVEQFGAHLEEHLFSICRGVSGLLAQARLAAPQPPQAASRVPMTRQWESTETLRQHGEGEEL